MCHPGWSGSACDQCTENPDCVHGRCVDTPFQCQCYDGYQGTCCEEPICSEGCHPEHVSLGYANTKIKKITYFFRNFQISGQNPELHIHIPQFNLAAPLEINIFGVKIQIRLIKTCLLIFLGNLYASRGMLVQGRMAGRRLLSMHSLLELCQWILR